MEIINTGKVSIETKYLGPTNHRGSRIKAIASGDSKRSITVSYDHAKNPDENHIEAAIALCKKYKWEGKLAMGGKEDGCVFAFIS